MVATAPCPIILQLTPRSNAVFGARRTANQISTGTAPNSPHWAGSTSTTPPHPTETNDRSLHSGLAAAAGAPQKIGESENKISGAATRQRNWGHQGDRGRVPQPVDRIFYILALPREKIHVWTLENFNVIFGPFARRHSQWRRGNTARRHRLWRRGAYYAGPT
jgi:hypothetical protein